METGVQLYNSKLSTDNGVSEVEYSILGENFGNNTYLQLIGEESGARWSYLKIEEGVSSIYHYTKDIYATKGERFNILGGSGQKGELIVTEIDDSEGKFNNGLSVGTINNVDIIKSGQKYKPGDILSISNSTSYNNHGSVWVSVGVSTTNNIVYSTDNGINWKTDAHIEGGNPPFGTGSANGVGLW